MSGRRSPPPIGHLVETALDIGVGALAFVGYTVPSAVIVSRVRTPEWVLCHAVPSYCHALHLNCQVPCNGQQILFSSTLPVGVNQRQMCVRAHASTR